MPSPFGPRKGDLAVIKRTRSDVGAAGTSTQGPRTTYEIGTVLSVNVRGIVQSARSLYGGTIKRGQYAVDDIIYESSKRVDVAAAIAAARRHHYPGHPGQPMDYESLGDVTRAFMPYRLQGGKRIAATARRSLRGT
jgi:hypothetical protein